MHTKLWLHLSEISRCLGTIRICFFRSQNRRRVSLISWRVDTILSISSGRFASFTESQKNALYFTILIEKFSRLVNKNRKGDEVQNFQLVRLHLLVGWVSYPQEILDRPVRKPRPIKSTLFWTSAIRWTANDEWGMENGRRMDGVRMQANAAQLFKLKTKKELNTIR